MAIILAAGTGVRLRAVHSERPKGFVEVGGGPIIARSVAALRRAGVREFVFVVGWRGSVYRSWCATECPGALCVENVDFATTGSLRSLVLGCAVVPGRKVVVVESDLLFEQRAPDCLLAAATENTVLLSDFTDSRDEVWAYAQADDPTRLRFLTKTKSMIEREPVGELVGLSLFSETLVEQLGVAARALPPTAHAGLVFGARIDGLFGKSPQNFAQCFGGFGHGGIKKFIAGWLTVASLLIMPYF